MADDDIDNPAPEEKSIRDSIESAIADVGEPDEAAPPKPRPAPAPERDRDEMAEGIEERPRDAQGRFIRQDGSPITEIEPKKPEVPPQPRPEGEQPKEPAEDTREQRLARMTRNWRTDHKEFLARQAPEVQDFLAERDAEMNTAFQRKSQEIAYLRNEYGPIHDMLMPEMPAIRAAGFTPRMLIEGWANAERALLSGPQQAATTLRTIAEGYQIPREVVAAAFGFDVRTPQEIVWAAQGYVPQQEAAPQYYQDPRVDQLLAAAQDQQERAAIMQAQNFRVAANNMQAQINQFRDAVDARGNLLRPHFAEVEDHMTMLAQHASQTTGRIPPLQELYDSAVYANPATRAKVLADAQRAQSEKQRQAVAARGKADMARRAGSSVVGMGSNRPNNRTQGQSPNKGAGIRASIDAAFDHVMGDEQ